MRTTQLIKSAECYLDPKMCGKEVLMKHADGMIKRTHKQQRGTHTTNFTVFWFTFFQK